MPHVHHFMYRTSVETLAKVVSWDAALSRDTIGYEIGPHTDARTKLVSMLYYLPKNHKVSPKSGTYVLRSRTGQVQQGHSKRCNFGRDFATLKQVKFAPNSVFAFAPCYSSWHAVRRVDSSEPRDTIQAFLKDARPKALRILKGRCPGTRAIATAKGNLRPCTSVG